MTTRPFSERLPVPSTVLIALFGMLAVAGISVTRILQAAAASTTQYPIAVFIGVTVAAGIMLSFIPLVAAWAVRSAWKTAPVLTTIVGVWTALQTFDYIDVLAVVGGAAGIAAAVAVWLPSARKYAVDLRALRQG